MLGMIGSVWSHNATLKDSIKRKDLMQIPVDISALYGRGR